MDQQEVVAQAYIPEAIPSGTGHRTESEKMAAAASESLQQNNWREGLQRLQEVQDIRVGSLDVVEQVGLRRNTDPEKGGEILDRTGDEKDRYEQATKTKERLSTFVEKGYASLSDTDKKEVRKGIRQQIMANPVLAKQFRDAILARPGALTVDALLDRFASDPRVQAELKRSLAEFSQERKIDDTTLQNAEVAYAEATLIHAEKQRVTESINVQITSIDTQLKTFQRDPSGTPIEAGSRKIADIEDRLPTIQKEIEEQKAQIAPLQIELTGLVNQRNNILKTGKGDLDAVTTLITNRESMMAPHASKIAELSAQIQELNDLRTREKDLRQSKTELEASRSTAALDATTAFIEVRKRRMALDQAVALRTSDEVDLVNEMEGMVGDAFNGVMLEDLDKLLQEFDKRNAEHTQQAETQEERDFASMQRTRWSEKRERRAPIRRWKKTSDYALKATEIGNDAQILFARGDRGLMEHMLVGQSKPDGTPYTVEDVQKLLDSDRGKVMMKDTVKQLLTLQGRTNEIKPGELEVIANSEWGNTLLTEGLSDAKFQEQLGKVAETSGVSVDELKERMQKEYNKNPMWLLLLLGIPLSAVALGMALKK